jgi:circadian clock protein KaiC
MAKSEEKELRDSPARRLPRGDERASTGIPAFDEVLAGGLPRDRLYLVQGDPGVGKTTLSLQFLLEGARQGEKVLYITLSETKEELIAVAESHGWSLEGIELCDVSVLEEDLAVHEAQSVFHSSEVEFPETVKFLIELIDKVQPARLVLDSLTELRLMASDALRYRRQILLLKRHVSTRNCTVLLVDERTGDGGDLQLRSLAHGVIELENRLADFGTIRRTLQVVKLRGVQFREGRHDYVIHRGGLVVFPRLVAAEHRGEVPTELLQSGIPEMDALLGGGIPRGFSVLLLGPAGVGKSTVAFQYALAAAQRGEHAALYLFDERPSTVLLNVVGAQLQPHMDSGRVLLQQIDPAELSPGEFIHSIRHTLDSRDLSVVVIDGLDGFMQSMPGDKHLLLHLHEISTFLGQRGVTTLMTKVQPATMVPDPEYGASLTCIADAVLVFRYFDFGGAIHPALSVFKKRGGAHERTIRELHANAQGLSLGPALTQFRGVLTGLPIHEERREVERREG